MNSGGGRCRGADRADVKWVVLPLVLLLLLLWPLPLLLWPSVPPVLPVLEPAVWLRLFASLLRLVSTVRSI